MKHLQGSFAFDGIKQLASNLPEGQHKKKCPECHHTREKHRQDRSLSLKIDVDGVRYFCHHCNTSGGWMHEDIMTLDFPKPISKPIKVPTSSNAYVTDYLKSRRISDDVIEKHTVTGTYSFNGTKLPAVGFPYRDGDNIVAIKWRSAGEHKYYSQENVCQDFFNMDSYVPGNDVLVVEGEIDVLSWLSCDLPKDCTVVSLSLIHI